MDSNHRFRANRQRVASSEMSIRSTVGGVIRAVAGEPDEKLPDGPGALSRGESAALSAKEPPMSIEIIAAGARARRRDPRC
jgi:hypothetical protein